MQLKTFPKRKTKRKMMVGIGEFFFGKYPGERMQNLWHSVNPFDDVTAKEAAERNRELNKE